ncbi:MAG TPA: DUF6064 family protein [Ignavibacteriaceae bacterium]|nr:DUF6064 family protein [Ignavibacteriaceae bacterium]
MPFTTKEFLEVFKNYNLSVYPAQIILNLAAILILSHLFLKRNYSDKFINLFLAILWLWIGIVYHWLFFTSINGAAYGFAVLFILQALIFIYFGVYKDKIKYDYKKNDNKVISLFIIAYSLILYPLLGIMGGHIYPYNPTFGLPCPTTIFTFGIVLFANTRIKWYFIIIPILWSIIGLSAVWNFSIYEDVGLIMSALISVYYILTRSLKDKKLREGTIPA